MNIELLIYCYMFVCISMILFNVAYIFLSKRKNNEQKEKTKFAKREMEKALKNLQNNISVSDEHKKYLQKKLKKPSNLTVFNSVIIYFAPIYGEYVQLYLNDISEVFPNLCKTYKKKGSTESAYFAYLISKYRICSKTNDNQITDLMFTLLNNESLYCRENALRVFYVLGNVDYVVKAIHIVDDKKYFHHSKLITDGLLKFEGNYGELIEKFLYDFDTFSISMRVTILNYIRYQTNGGYEEIMLNILNDESQNDEIRLAALKYFKKVKYDKAYSTLVSCMDENRVSQIDFTIVGALTLINYPSENTLNILKNALKSNYWYVRSNASLAIEKIGATQSDLQDVLNGNDEYAKEIIKYRLEQRNIDEQLNER